MKICAIISEFNPFHNGHEQIIAQAKRLSQCDYLICIMSGQFTQRGDVCRCDKFVRAKHAILAGADAVIELPAPFAVAPAEIFATGAIKLISQIPAKLSICFGSESGSAEDFIKAAKLALCESDQFKNIITKHLSDGNSYIKSYCKAFAELGGDEKLISSPNNILGVEYCKAILKRNLNVKIYTTQRLSGDKFAPAHTIRELSAEGKDVSNFIPPYALDDYINTKTNTERFEQACADAIFFNDERDIMKVFGCKEGLENRLKDLATETHGDYKKIIEEATSKRYSSARIKRIMTANLLKLYARDTTDFLNAPLRLKILAVKNEVKNKLLPIITIKPCNYDDLDCYALNSDAYAIWQYLSPQTAYKNEREKTIFI